MYLWSFRYREVAPALYVGTILSFMPVIGVQIPLAFLFALLLRANLPIFVALQFITNWLTVVPLYYICYEIGRFTLKVFDVHVDALSMDELRLFMEHLAQHQWAENGHFILRVLGVTSLGGLVVGSFLGTVFDQIYKLLAWRAGVIWKRVAVIRIKRVQDMVARLDAARLDADKQKPSSEPERKDGDK